MQCKICNADAETHFKGTVLGRNIGYSECAACGYVQTQEPYWLEEAYEEVINKSDTGIMARNLSNANIVITTSLVLGVLRGRVVDAAGGMGILVRLLRDYGMDAAWLDRYCENALARGFEYDGGSANLVTAFEAFEHFVHPVVEMDALLAIAPNLLISTVLMPRPTPSPGEWWYYGPEHGQHIGFYRRETLEYLARRSEKYLLTNGSYHLFSDKPVSAWLWRKCLQRRSLVCRFARKRLRSRTWNDYLIVGQE